MQVVVPERLEVRSADALMLRVEHHGSGAFPVSVLIHGYGEGAYVWKACLRDITACSSAYLVNLRGHGDSDWDPQRRYDAPTHARDVEHIVRQVAPAAAVLIGHSLGALVALLVAARAPTTVAALVLVDFGPTPAREVWLQARDNLARSLRGYATVAEYASWLERSRPLTQPDVLPQLAHDALRADVHGFTPKVDPALARWEYEDLSAIAGTGLWPVLASLTCPVLIVRGSGSAVLTRAEAQRMAGSIAYARLTEIEASGHAVVTDNPQELGRVIRHFISELCAERVHAQSQPISRPRSA